jgi:hypothetical protein
VAFTSERVGIPVGWCGRGSAALLGRLCLGSSTVNNDDEEKDKDNEDLH